MPAYSSDTKKYHRERVRRFMDDPEDGEWVRTKENRDKTDRRLHSEIMPGMDARKGKAGRHRQQSPLRPQCAPLSGVGLWIGHRGGMPKRGGMGLAGRRRF